MTTNEQLIAQIKELISLLTTEKSTLQEGSKAFNTNTKQIDAYSIALRKLTGDLSATAREIATLESGMTKLTAALTSGESKRIRAAGLQSRTANMPRLGQGPTQTDVEAGFAEPTTNAVYSRRVNDQLAASQRKETLQDQKAYNEKYKRILAEEDFAEKEAIRSMKTQVQEREALENRKVKAQEKALQEQLRIQRNQNIGLSVPGGQLAAQNLYKQAGRVDPRFTPETLRKIETEPTTNISRASFSYLTDEGVVKKATFTLDQYGKVLVDTQKRFRDFGSSIIRNTAEVFKWSVAVSLIYLPMQKLGELMTVMVQNEAALADVTISLGNAQKSLLEIFQASNQIAQVVGESVNKVIEAYNAAYRATGGIESSTERFAVTNKLLTDALTLSKLSLLDEAEAIDILSAALKQTAQSDQSLSQTLSGGTALLNKWIAVSRVANVDLATLATGFSVVGDAADAANINTDKLNAVLATISETTSMSSKEVANATRAMVSGFQTDQAQKALQSLGIAIVDVDGKARNFLDISEEINRMLQSGALSKKQFSELTAILGGGSRRGPVVSTFIQNLSKIPEIEKVSMAANADTGESFDALGKRLDTVQTATTKLGNSFQSLAESLGESGGILDITKTLLLTLNDIVGALARVAESAGKAGPVLATALAAFLYLKNQGPGFMPALNQGIFSGASNLYSAAGKTGLGSFAPLTKAVFGGDINRVQTGATVAGQFAQRVVPYAPAVLATGASALQNFSQGRTAQGLGNIFGGAAGTAIGASLGGPAGALIGSALGSAIAEGIVNSAESFKPKFEEIFSEAFVNATTKPPTGKILTPQERRTQQQQQALENVTNLTGGSLLGGLVGKIQGGVLNAAGAISGGDKFKGFTDAQSTLIILGLRHQLGLISDAVFDKAIKDLQLANAPTAVEQADAETKNKLENQITEVQKRFRAELVKKLATGGLGLAPYRQGTEALGNLGATGSKFYNAFGQGGNAGQFLTQVGRVTSFLKPEQYADLTQMSGDIQELNDRLKQLDKTDKDYQATVEERNAKIASASRLLQDLNQQVLQQANLLQEVDIRGLSQKGGGPVNLDRIKSMAIEIERQTLQKNVDLGAITPEEMEAKLKVLQDIILQTDQGLEGLKQVPVEYINAAIENLKAQGELIEKQTKGLGFQTIDLTAKEFASLVTGPGSQYAQKANQLQQAGYQLDEQDWIAIFKDNVVKPEHLDSKIVQLLLQDIKNINQKQLDGMFNLPEGASFWIPAQAAKLLPQNLGGTEEGFKNVSAQGKANTPQGYEEAWRAFKNAEQRSMGGIPTGYMESLNKFRAADLASMPRTVADPALRGIPYGPGGYGPPAPAGLSQKPQGFDIGQVFQNLGQQLQNLATKLELTISNTISLNVDGRQMAQVVKEYLKDDLVRYSGGVSQKNINVM